MGAGRDMAADLVEMALHGPGVGIGKHESRAGIAGRADRAEQVRVAVALVPRLAWPRAAWRPLPHEAVLLADPHLVSKPDLGRRARGYAVEDDRHLSCRARFF